LDSCRQRPDDAAPKVTNAKGDVENHYFQVVELKFKIGNGLTTTCSAIFVSPTTALTAAHCADSADSGVSTNQEIEYDHIKAKYWVTHPTDKYHKYSLSALDLAVVIFPVAVMFPNRPHWHESIGTPGIGDSVIMVGYGVSDISDVIDFVSSGTKRYGTNVIKDVRAGVIIIEGLPRKDGKTPIGINSATGKGDSGGPLFNAKGELIGITSVGTPIGDEKKVTAFVDLSTSASRRVLCLAGYNGARIPGITFETCGAYATAKSCDYEEIPDTGDYKKLYLGAVNVTCK